MTASFTTAELGHAVTMLSSPSLIRLITEIDDHGPIPSRGLARTLPDLAPYQIRHATEQAHRHGLVRQESGLHLTESGEDLAELYDTAARWARQHQYPALVADFATRIRHTLALLAEPAVFDALTAAAEPSFGPGGALPTAQAAAGLAGPWNLLTQWLRANPQAARPTEGEPAA